MTRIGLVSDTHGFVDDRIAKLFEKVDEVWHAGDFGSVDVADRLDAIAPLRAVYGNIDGAELRKRFPLDARFEIEGMHIWMTHIGGYPGRYSPRVRELLLEGDPPDLFICGHSHIVKVIRDKRFSMLTVNPGAAGKQGFQKVRTVMRFAIDGGKLQDMELIELGKR